MCEVYGLPGLSQKVQTLDVKGKVLKVQDLGPGLELSS